MNALTLIGNVVVVIDSNTGKRVTTLKNNAASCVSYKTFGAILLDNGDCFRYNLNNCSNMGKFGPSQKVTNINISCNVVIFSDSKKTWRYNIENGMCIGS